MNEGGRILKNNPASSRTYPARQTQPGFSCRSLTFKAQQLPSVMKIKVHVSMMGPVQPRFSVKVLMANSTR